MNDNNIRDLSTEGSAEPKYGGRNRTPDVRLGSMSPSSPLDEDDKQPQDGLTFNLFPFLIGLAAGVWYYTSGNDWKFILYLAIVVVIHELGHVVVGKSFGCMIKEMQVFFLSFLIYKPKQIPGGSAWRNITWSLGVLPFGGVTVFKTGESNYYGGGTTRKLQGAASPFINEKPAWQRLLISVAGVLFNFATFLILYFILPYLPFAWLYPCQAIASLSLILAVLNILPVYPLDGGAIVFALYEMISGRKPSPQFTRVCGMIGFSVIILFFWVFPEWLNSILDSVFHFFF